MTLTLLFADGTTQAALTDSTVYPGGSSIVRSYADIYLSENLMTLAELEAWFSDITKTSSIHFILKNDEDSILADEVYNNFILLTQCGKRIIQHIDNATGTATEQMCLAVRLEQPTYTEQLIEEIQQAYHIVTEGE